VLAAVAVVAAAVEAAVAVAVAAAGIGKGGSSIMIQGLWYRTLPLRVALILAVGLCISPATIHAAEPGQLDFATPGEAVTALVNAARADDLKGLLAVLGTSAQRLITSGDPVQDKNARAQFVSFYDAKNSLAQRAPDRMELVIGANDWPVPLPLVQKNGRWAFDSTAAADELVSRRIGKNELMTIRTLLATVAAQQDYFARFKAGTGTGAYAQRILSTADRTDGLYWDVEDGQPPSPLGPLVDQARDEGYPGEIGPGGKPVAYHGYYFRVLKAQGPNAIGGAKDYLRNGQMTGGFAMLAWPADYENSGVVTFIVGPDGVVYQKDLGPATARAAAAITRFDPDLSWARIDIAD